MKRRCTNQVGTGRCGLRIPRSRKGFDHGAHWPHRYVEQKFVARVKHEWSLHQHGFTTWADFALAMMGRAR